jgi:hypothetical protein
MRAHMEEGTAVFTRLSEVEPAPAYLTQASGVWLDTFGNQWYDSGVIESLLNQGKRVCVVSMELHGKDPAGQWGSLRGLAGHPGLMLCTDEPELACQHFPGSVVRD